MDLHWKKTFLTGIIIPCLLGSLATSAQKNSLLWEISGNGLRQPSYLFGTIHLTCGDYQLTDKVKEALSKSSGAVFELDMDDPQLALSIQRHAMNPGNKNLKEDLNEEDAKKINQFLIKHYGADLSQLGIIKPFALLSMILIKNTPCGQISSVEQLLVQETRKMKIDVKGLETIEYQVSIFDGIPIDDQINWILEAVSEDYTTRYADMLNAYKAEDLEKLQLLIAESPGMEANRDLLLNHRNQNWIPVIEEQIKQETIFYAVGAGHLAGSGGLIQLLQQKGYTISAVIE